MSTKPDHNAEQSLYDRLGGVYAIATVTDHFSESLTRNDNLKHNPALVEAEARVPIAGLKFLRTLFFCEATGGPYTYTGKALDDAHKDLAITGEEFDEVVAELKRSLDHFEVPESEKNELLDLFISQKGLVATA